MRLLKMIAYLTAGYVSGAVATYFLVSVLSNNNHDRSLEAIMTSLFIGGPIISIIGLGMGWKNTK